MSTTKKVCSLVAGEAVLYKGRKYQVDNIEAEGTVRIVKLLALTHPREVVCAVWNADSEVTYSQLETSRHYVSRHVATTTFEIQDIETQAWDFGDQSHTCMQCMGDKKRPCVSIHKCFGETFLGLVYCVSS